MTVTAAWTDPVTLDRAVGATYPLASYELLLGDVLWLFDVLTDVIATSLKFGSTLEVVGAVTLDSTLAVTGATTVAGLHATGTVTADGGDYGSGGGAATHPNGLTSTTGAFTGAVTANAGDYGSGGGAATHPAGLTATTGSFSGAVTANGNTTRSVTYGTNIANNPSMATGTYWDATVTLADPWTPSAVTPALSWTAGYPEVLAFVEGISAGSVVIRVLNLTGSTIPAGVIGIYVTAVI